MCAIPEKRSPTTPSIPYHGCLGHTVWTFFLSKHAWDCTLNALGFTKCSITHVGLFQVSCYTPRTHSGRFSHFWEYKIQLLLWIFSKPWGNRQLCVCLTVFPHFPYKLFFRRWGGFRERAFKHNTQRHRSAAWSGIIQAALKQTEEMRTGFNESADGRVTGEGMGKKRLEWFRGKGMGEWQRFSEVALPSDRSLLD